MDHGTDEQSKLIAASSLDDISNILTKVANFKTEASRATTKLAICIRVARGGI